MAPDSTDQRTPEEWRSFLLGKLDQQAQVIQGPADYYNGQHKLAFATSKFRDVFARFFPPMAINWMKVVVDKPVSRLQIQGFRFDPDPAEPDWEEAADPDAEKIWQASNMDSGSSIVHTDAIKYGLGYVLVIPVDPGNRDPDAEPRIIPQRARECFVYRDQADRQTRLAGVKRWVDDHDQHAYCTVFLPDDVLTWQSHDPIKDNDLSKVVWDQFEADDNPIGLVPLIPVENKPDLEYGGRSDLEEAIPIQDAINKYCLDMMVSSEFHAFPQRTATGWAPPTDDAGNPLSGREVEIKMGVSRLLTATDPETKFGQLAPGDVQNYIQPIEQFLDMLGSVTDTPAYSLKGSMANISSDAMHAADTGLVERCRRKIDNAFSDNWEDVMRCAFLAKGDKDRGNALTAEVIWQDPERRSISQSVDAAVKMRTSLSVPIEMCWQTLGWSPQQIRMARDMMKLPPGGPAAPQVAPLSDPSALIVDPLTGEYGKGVEPTIKEGAPVVLGPSGQPLPPSQQPSGAGSTHPGQG